MEEFPKARVGSMLGAEVQMFCIVFSVAQIRNVFPQDRLWPGSEPNVNILAEASPLNRIEMVWGKWGWRWGQGGKEGGKRRDLTIEFRDCWGLFSQWVPRQMLSRNWLLHGVGVVQTHRFS